MAQGKRQTALLEKVDREKLYATTEAVNLLKETVSAKFEESVDAVFRLGLDPKINENRIRATVILPKGRGKTERILVIAKGEKIKEAEAAGADFAGSDELLAKIEGGWMEFDRMISTPDMMSGVGKLGRVLGPRGLMPSPKSGTVTLDVGAAVEEFKRGKIEFRLDEFSNVHVPFGVGSFSVEDLKENLVALMGAILSEKPEGAKGKYLKAVSISTTMGPGIKLDPDELAALAAS
jgi:large subunit ribosomal protein L1